MRKTLTLLRALLLVEVLLALYRILLLALGLVRLRLLTLLRLCGLLRLSLILLTGLAELLLTGLILPRLRGLTLKPARLLLVLRTLRLRRPILLGILRGKSLLLRAASRRLRLRNV